MFWQLFKESVIIQAVLALLFSVAIVTLYVMGKPVPGELVSLVMLIIGFYFGQKTAISGEVQARNLTAYYEKIASMMKEIK